MLKKFLIESLNYLESKEQEDKEVYIRYHPGVYKFYFPYIPYTPFSFDDNISVYMCEVEMFIGQERDMEEGYLGTVIIHVDRNSIGMSNVIENVASKIRWSFFDNIFYERFDEPSKLNGNSIRWIEHHPKDYASSLFRDGKWSEVKMQWDDKRKCYYGPEWDNYTGYYMNDYDQRALEIGAVVSIDMPRGNYPTLGREKPVVILDKYRNSNQIVVLPISDDGDDYFSKGLPYIKLSENKLDLSEDLFFRFDSIRTIDEKNVKKTIGKISKKTFSKVMDYWLSLSTLDRELIGFSIYRDKFILNETISLEENRIYEFKSVNSNRPEKAISSCVDEYICSFLNSRGGKIFYGIKDDGLIEGVHLNRSSKDELNRLISGKIEKIEPKIDPTSIVIEYHQVYAVDGEEVEGRYVLEIIVPKSYESTLYFANGKDAWLRVDGVKKSLKGPALIEWIKRNL